jgi:flavin-binding protein dodecin
MEDRPMPDSVYKVIDLIGSSPNSWEEAVKNVVEKASKSLKDLRVAEVKELDVKLEDGKIVAYRAKVSVSFKLEGKVVIDFYA